MKIIWFLIYCSLIAFGCTDQQQNSMQPELISNNSISESSKDSIKFKQFINSILSQHNEEPLNNYRVDCFRMFLWRFRHPNITIIRIQKDSLENVKLIAKEIISPSFEYNPKTDSLALVNVVERQLTLSDWNSLLELVDQSYFWTMNENEYPPWSGTDGSLWYIEANRLPTFQNRIFMPFKTYNSVKRHVPHKGSFYNLGEKIAVLSGLIKPADLF